MIVIRAECPGPRTAYPPDHIHQGQPSYTGWISGLLTGAADLTDRR